MRKSILLAAAAFAMPAAAFAQDATVPPADAAAPVAPAATDPGYAATPADPAAATPPADAAAPADAMPATTGTATGAGPMTSSFRGFRVEGNVGGDRFQSQGTHNDKFGYGATIGFDGQIGDKIVVGPEASFWRANNWSQNCTQGGALCQKSFEEYGVAVRAGYLVTPDLLVFGKGGYVSNEQRTRISTGAGAYSRGRTDGYQVGGGVEYTLTSVHTPVPVYVNAQYVYSNYENHTARQRVMAGVGIRFR